ncbi:TIGR03619 family F420-dependent LLM class oxidoreductase [Pseudonocardia sp. GCM10023141]|uniref:TIGR03619 family F420-dependent LLM class oxidoreductase n=1 Tax=Pseudonocardia sp. GCM10023141 TaxID=3252653 RepID=UPI003615FDB1
MKIGLVVDNHGSHAIDNVQTWPAEAERLGFHSLWFTDHVIGLTSYAPRFSTTWAESLTSLSFAAARTSTIRVGVGVMVVPYRNPVYAAKVLATIDLLSGGRLDVGVGVGWSRSEYKALGVGDLFDVRGAYTDESLDVMQRCWAGGTLGYQGTWNAFREIDFSPAPAQPAGPPLWVGGHSGPALRRAARFAATWHPMGLQPLELAAAGDRLDAIAGREITRTTRILVPASIGSAELQDQLVAFAGVGCVEVAVDISTPDAGEFRDAAQRLAGSLSALAGT